MKHEAVKSALSVLFTVQVGEEEKSVPEGQGVPPNGLLKNPKGPHSLVVFFLCTQVPENMQSVFSNILKYKSFS